MTFEILNYDIDAHEAEIIVSDGRFSLLSCSYDCDDEFFIARLNDNAVIKATFSRDIYMVDDIDCSAIKDTNSYFGYNLVGIKCEGDALLFGTLRIVSDEPFPKDIKNGEFVHLYSEKIIVSAGDSGQTDMAETGEQRLPDRSLNNKRQTLIHCIRQRLRDLLRERFH